jgi:hypothetical protein
MQQDRGLIAHNAFLQINTNPPEQPARPIVRGTIYSQSSVDFPQGYVGSRLDLTEVALANSER